MLYQFVKIPTSLGIVVDHEADSLESARDWAKANLDTSTRWIVKLDGQNVGEAFIFTHYSCTYSDKVQSYTRNSWPKSGLFETKEAALADRNKHRAEAASRLELAEQAINKELRALGVSLSYEMQGDTHGIYEDYMYLEVRVENYYFRRKLEN